jgi:hypothetical protein
MRDDLEPDDVIYRVDVDRAAYIPDDDEDES